MKICLTTFVQGHLYQEYLPMLIYSIGKAYPEYDVKIVSRFGNIPSQIVRT